MDISHNHTQYTDPPPAPLETQAFPGNPHLHFIKLGNLEKKNQNGLPVYFSETSWKWRTQRRQATEVMEFLHQPGDH